MRLLLVGIGYIAMLGVAAAGEPEMIRDPAYRAKAGERSVIDSSRPVGFTTLAAYIQGDKFLKAKDETGLKQLREAGELLDLSNRVPVLTVKWVELRPRGPSSSSFANFAHNLQAAQFKDYPSDAMEVRILDGEHAGKLLVVRQDDVARLIPAPKLSAKAKARAKAQAKAKAKAEAQAKRRSEPNQD
jgi:hypothetical protein